MEARAAWREGMMVLAPEKRVFLDEPKVRAAKAASIPRMARRFGRAAWGERPV